MEGMGSGSSSGSGSGNSGGSGAMAEMQKKLDAQKKVLRERAMSEPAVPTSQIRDLKDPAAEDGDKSATLPEGKVTLGEQLMKFHRDEMAREQEKKQGRFTADQGTDKKVLHMPKLSDLKKIDPDDNKPDWGFKKLKLSPDPAPGDLFWDFRPDTALLIEDAISYYEMPTYDDDFEAKLSADRQKAKKEFEENRKKQEKAKKKEEEEKKKAEKNADKEQEKPESSEKESAKEEKKEAAAHPQVLQTQGIQGRVILPSLPSYERQENNNCYAVTAAAMFNRHLEKKGLLSGATRLDQSLVRGYRPAFKTYEEYRKQLIDDDGKQTDDRQRYKSEKNSVATFSTPDSAALGNIYVLSDMFFQLDSSICTNNMNFSYSGLTPEAHKQMQDYFLKTVAEVISKGEAIGFFKQNHYMTIVGVEGAMVKYLNSVPPGGELKDSKTGQDIDFDPNEVHEIPVWNILSGVGGTVELTWFSDRSDLKNDVQKYEGLKCDKKDTFSSTWKSRGLDDVAHTLGVAAKRKTSSLIADGLPDALKENISHIVYTPKTDQDPTLNLETLRRRVNTYIGIQESNLIQMGGGVEAQERALQAYGKAKKESDSGASPEDPSKETVKAEAKDSDTATKKSKGADSNPDTGEAEESVSVTSSTVVEADIEDAVVSTSAESLLQRQQSELPARKPMDDLTKDYHVAKVAGLGNAVSSFIRQSMTPNWDEFNFLKQALENNRPIIRELIDGHFNLTEDSYEKYLTIYQAASAFVTKYEIADTDGLQFYHSAALKIKNALDKVSKKVLSDNNVGDVSFDVDYEEPEKKAVLADMERFLIPYRTFCERIDEDLIATDEEKLRRKWDALKSNERDVLIYLDIKKKGLKQGESLKPDDAFLEREYTSLKRQILLLNLTKGNGEEEKKTLNTDDGLSREQIAALSRIDTWLIRNFRNGGLMSLQDVRADRTDFVGKLLGMSRRKRMFIYYLVETRERVDPTNEGFGKSQTSYIPDLGKFKGRMIANKLKFYKRFTGGYIYWHKLTEAMAIADRADTMLNISEEMFTNGGINLPDEPTDYSKIEEKDRGKKAVEDALTYAFAASLILRDNERKDITKEQKEENKRKLSDLEQKSKTAFAEVINVAKQMKEVENKEFRRSEDVKQYGKEMFSDAAAITSLAVGVTKNVVVPELDPLATLGMEEVSGYFNAGPAAFSAIGGLIGSLCGIYQVMKNGDSMTELDNMATSFGAIKGLLAAGRSVTKVVGVFKDDPTIKTITGATAGAIFAGVDAGIALIKTGSYFKKRHYRKRAERLATAKQDKDEFDNAMLALSQKIGKRQKTSTLTSVATAGCTATAAALVALSVFTAGASLVAGAAVFGIGMYAKTADANHQRDARMMLFDSFFHTDDEYNRAVQQYNARNPKVPLTEEAKLTLYDQVRRRIAVNNGFYSPSHASKFVAGRYAKTLLERAHAGAQDETNLYIAIIRGLGVKYKYDNNPTYDVPSEKDIVKKLCG